MGSSLIVEVCEIREIKKHSNADSLEICIVKGWECIVPIDKYKVGDLVVYIPVDSILPDELGDRLGVRNYLGGRNRNRVRCAKLRREMSYGLIIDNEEKWEVGTDVAEHYGITRYTPPTRATCGDAAPNDPLFGRFTDIENIRNFPDIFTHGEEVVVTEKLDGSLDRLGFAISIEENVITTKWKAGSNRIKRYAPEPKKIAENIYWFPFSLKSVKNLLDFLAKDEDIKMVTLFGEVYGRVRGGHKSMHYGKPNSLNYAAFSLKINGKYISWDKFYDYCERFEVPVVPIIDRCLFDMEIMKKYATGPSVLAQENGADHIREGIVIVSAQERNEVDTDRAILKMLNPNYLILKSRKEDKGENVDFTDE